MVRRSTTLQRGGHDAGGNDVRNGLGGFLDGMEGREQGLDGLRFLEKSNRNFRNDCEGPLGPDSAPHHVITDAFTRGAPEPDDRAIGENRLDFEDVVGRHSVLEAVGSAGVFATCRRCCMRPGWMGRERSRDPGAKRPGIHAR